MCATDIRPFSIVDGAGFKKVAQKLISLGAQYGNVKAGDVLPCTTTMSHHLNTVVAARKADVTEKLLTDENFDITTDGWTHITTNHQYITITDHYTDNEWNLLSNILAIRLPGDKHTAHYIKNFVGDILQPARVSFVSTYLYISYDKHLNSSRYLCIFCSQQ